MKFLEGLGVFAVLAWFCLIIGGLIGYVMNIIAIVHAVSADAPIHAMFIARCVGVFAFPLGGILGWF